MVAAHLLNYFETGMDYSSGGNRVQTLGTPWKVNYLRYLRLNSEGI
jgi:hypothetical protein